MKRALFAASLVAVAAALAAVTLFADNIRRVHGMSADALAGDAHVERRTRDHSLEMKRLTSFTPVVPNAVTDATRDNLSTFAIDVDTASYTYARRTLSSNVLPEPASIRVEEWINAFHYELTPPRDEPFAVSVEGAPSPFDEGRTLLKVALQGRRVANADRKPAHLVFLVDTSGSMSGADRLPLAQECLRILLAQLNARDTVALVTYAGSTRVALEPTPATDKARILAAIDSLSSGGGTAMGSGMELAYGLAVRSVRADEVSRVIVLTDGDANIGNRLGADAMLAAVKRYVEEGVTLTTVGFGMGNYRAALLERLADSGNGHSVYVDSRREAARVFGTEVAGTLEYIAKDVKVQVAFDASVVKSYRLVGYENRDVADADFRNDRVDGGELGAGHSVTALYELVLTGKKGALGVVHVRGQKPEGGQAFELATPMNAEVVASSLERASTELRFATAVALAADVLRGNPRADWSLERIADLADDASAGSEERREFVQLLRAAAPLHARRGPIARMEHATY